MNPLRLVPSVNDLLQNEKVISMIAYVGRDNIKTIIQEAINEIKQELLKLKATEAEDKMTFLTKEKLTEWVIRKAEVKIDEKDKNSLKKLINGTGIVLHTNMGRAPLSKRITDKLASVAGGYCNLEYSVEEGRRGSRYACVEELLVKMTGAESAVVVNNNAAAVYLCLHALANEKEVIVARSEQVEIGGSFRIPDIIKRSGAKMVEVGTTNKTYLTDFENAMTDETGLLLKVHKSNYRIEGFTSEVKGEELVSLAKQSGTILMEDVGSGVLIDLTKYGLPEEPTVASLVQKGIDVVTFSGDKLLGGPQAGIIVGKKEYIDLIKRNPMTRMVRIDKLSLIALEEVLHIYDKGIVDFEDLPAIDMLTMNETRLHEKADILLELMHGGLKDKGHFQKVECRDQPGGGSLPGAIMKGIAIAFWHDELSAAFIQKKLREHKIPIISIVHEERVILSLRTMDEKDFSEIVDALKGLLGENS